MLKIYHKTKFWLSAGYGGRAERAARVCRTAAPRRLPGLCGRHHEHPPKRHPRTELIVNGDFAGTSGKARPLSRLLIFVNHACLNILVEVGSRAPVMVSLLDVKKQT